MEREGEKGTSLFLRWWVPEEKKYHHEFLKFCLTGNKKEDRERRRLAETLRIQKESELLSQQFGTVPLEEKKTPFIEYFEQCKKDKGWEKTLVHLKEFPRRNIPLVQINENWVREIRNFLLTRPSFSQNSAHYYYSKIKACLNIAHRERIIDYKFHDNVDRVKVVPKPIEALTEKEIELLAKTSIKNNGLRRSFLFSCFTGLRYGDIQKLTFSRIDFTSNEITITQGKTGTLVKVPLLQQAREIALENVQPGTFPIPSMLVFPDMPSPQEANRELKKWNKLIKINLHFHTGRATYATILYQKTGNIYAVKEMLGHSSVLTTQKYVKIIPKTMSGIVNAAFSGIKI